MTLSSRFKHPFLNEYTLHANINENLRYTPLTDPRNLGLNNMYQTPYYKLFLHSENVVFDLISTEDTVLNVIVDFSPIVTRGAIQADSENSGGNPIFKYLTSVFNSINTFLNEVPISPQQVGLIILCESNNPLIFSEIIGPLATFGLAIEFEEIIEILRSTSRIYHEDLAGSFFSPRKEEEDNIPQRNIEISTTGLSIDHGQQVIGHLFETKSFAISNFRTIHVSVLSLSRFDLVEDYIWMLKGRNLKFLSIFSRGLSDALWGPRFITESFYSGILEYKQNEMETFLNERESIEEGHHREEEYHTKYTHNKVKGVKESKQERINELNRQNIKEIQNIENQSDKPIFDTNDFLNNLKIHKQIIILPQLTIDDQLSFISKSNYFNLVKLFGSSWSFVFTKTDVILSYYRYYQVLSTCRFLSENVVDFPFLPGGVQYSNIIGKNEQGVCSTSLSRMAYSVLTILKDNDELFNGKNQEINLKLSRNRLELPIEQSLKSPGEFSADPSHLALDCASREYGSFDYLLESGDFHNSENPENSQNPQTPQSDLKLILSTESVIHVEYSTEFSFSTHFSKIDLFPILWGVHMSFPIRQMRSDATDHSISIWYFMLKWFFKIIAYVYLRILFLLQMFLLFMLPSIFAIAVNEAFAILSVFEFDIFINFVSIPSRYCTLFISLGLLLSYGIFRAQVVTAVESSGQVIRSYEVIARFLLWTINIIIWISIFAIYMYKFNEYFPTPTPLFLIFLIISIFNIFPICLYIHSMPNFAFLGSIFHHGILLIPLRISIYSLVLFGSFQTSKHLGWCFLRRNLEEETSPRYSSKSCSSLCRSLWCSKILWSSHRICIDIPLEIWRAIVLRGVLGLNFITNTENGDGEEDVELTYFVNGLVSLSFLLSNMCVTLVFITEGVNSCNAIVNSCDLAKNVLQLVAYFVLWLSMLENLPCLFSRIFELCILPLWRGNYNRKPKLIEEFLCGNDRTSSMESVSVVPSDYHSSGHTEYNSSGHSEYNSSGHTGHHTHINTEYNTHINTEYNTHINTEYNINTTSEVSPIKIGKETPDSSIIGTTPPIIEEFVPSPTNQRKSISQRKQQNVSNYPTGLNIKLPGDEALIERQKNCVDEFVYEDGSVDIRREISAHFERAGHLWS